MPDTHRLSRADRILRLLETDGGWVDAIRLTSISLSYTRRIHELRMIGVLIELRDEWKGQKRRTAYKLVKPQRTLFDVPEEAQDAEKERTL